MRGTSAARPASWLPAFAAVLAAGALIGPWGGAAAQTPCPGADSGPEAGPAALAQATACLLAAERSAAGVGALALNGPLQTSAQAHAADMVANHYLAAESPDGTTAAARGRQAGYGPDATITVGEAFGYGTGELATPRAAVARGRAGPHVRAVILDPAARDLGIGVVSGAPTAVTAPAATYVADLGSQSVEPELGRSVVVGPAAGAVFVKTPGSNRFVPLTKRRAVRVGSVLNALRGTVRLTSASNAKGGKQTARFFDGTFRINQRRGARPVTELTLTGALPACGRGARASATPSKKRRVWGDGKGRFRTRGKYGTATVLGTRWLTEDTCAGTRITVRRGVVAVRDLRTGRIRRVRAGHSLLIPRRAP
jgi:uncharacterized protein YkwD